MRRLCVMLALFAVLVAACGGTSTDTEAPQDDAAAESSQQADTSDGSDTSEGADAEPADSAELDLGDDGELSLDDFIPGAFAFDENTDFRSQEMEIQQTIAACMAAEGFEYIPYVPAEVGGGFGYDDYDEEEYVKTHGFGVSTWIIEEEQYFEEGSEPWTDDPNFEITQAMDEFEAEEYYRVLYGGEPDIITNTPPEELEAMTEEELMDFYDEAYMEWEPDGCSNDAYNEFYGGGSDMDFWDEFGEDYEDVFIRAESDPRIVKSQTGWSACMADKGHDYATQEDMYAYFFGTESGGSWVEGEFQLKVNEVVTYPEPDYPEEGEFDEAAGEGSDSVTEATPGVAAAEGEGVFEYYGPEYDMEELQPLIDEELAIAVANYECSTDMRDIWEEVYKELEQQFIEDNLDRLLAFRDANG